MGVIYVGYFILHAVSIVLGYTGSGGEIDLKNDRRRWKLLIENEYYDLFGRTDQRFSITATSGPFYMMALCTRESAQNGSPR
jgi:hypothetical protein